MTSSGRKERAGTDMNSVQCLKVVEILIRPLKYEERLSFAAGHGLILVL